MVTTTTSTITCRRPKFPPSERHFEIYRFVKIERHSTRQAADEFHISQTRVRQVIDGIVEYLMECGPFDDEGKRVDRLQVAEQLAREQLEYLYGQAIDWWRRSMNDHRSGTGLPKASYLALAARITMCMARVPIHEPPRWRAENESDESEVGSKRSRAGETPAPHATLGEHPSVEDCSAPVVSRTNGDPAGEHSVAGSDSPDEAYQLLARIKSEARQNFLRPAQALVAEGQRPPTRGVSETPSETGPTTTGRPLNRKERRARQRRLERALAKR